MLRTSAVGLTQLVFLMSSLSHAAVDPSSLSAPGLAASAPAVSASQPSASPLLVAQDPQSILDRSVAKAIADMKAASGIDEASDGHSSLHMLIETYSAKTSDPAASICKTLLNLTVQDLTMTSEAVNSEATQPGSRLADCLPALQAKLKVYWAQQAQAVNEVHNKHMTVDDPGSMQPFTVIRREHNPTTISGPASMPGHVTTGGYGSREITLTFDDGPNNTTTPIILDTLKQPQYQAKAIFFNIGGNYTKTPSETAELQQIGRRIVDEGHSLGSHTHSHQDIGALVRQGHLDVAMNEIKLGHAEVFSAIGILNPFFRYPYGSRSAPTDAYVGQERLSEFAWNMDSLDWKTPDVNQLISHTESILQQTGGGILLMHDIHPQTQMAVPVILRYLHDQGYTLILPVTQDERTRQQDVALIKDLTMQKDGLDAQTILNAGAVSRSRFRSATGVQPLP